MISEFMIADTKTKMFGIQQVSRKKNDNISIISGKMKTVVNRSRHSLTGGGREGGRGGFYLKTGLYSPL